MQHHITLRQGLGLRAAGALAAFAAAMLLLLAPGHAHAGDYHQYFCSSGSGDPHANAFYPVGNAAPSAFCNPGAGAPYDGVYFNTATLPLNGYGAMRAEAPAGASYRSINLNLRVPYQASNRRTYVEANSRYVFSWHNGWGGSSSYNPAGNYVTYDFGSGSGYFEVGQACHGSDAAGCESGDFHFTGIDAILSDVTDPSVVADPVGIFEPARTAFRGSVVVRSDITDSGHGPRSAQVQVDDVTAAGTYADWGASCNVRLAAQCPPRLDWAPTIATGSYPDGVHTVRVVADDGVGQRAFTERSVVFDNTAPVPGPKPAIDGQTVTADAARLELSASDATTSVARIERSIDGGPWQTAATGAAAVVNVLGVGSHTVLWRAVDGVGNTSADQTVSFTLQAAPANQQVTTVEDQPLPGAPGPGDTLKCAVGGPWTQGTTFTYRWLRDGQVIDGATGQTYTVVPADVGHELTCRATAHNVAGETDRDAPPVTVGSNRCFGQIGQRDACGDFDTDGQDNAIDPDDDGDGIPDGEDADPFNPAIPGTGSATATGASASGVTGAAGARGADGAAGASAAAGPAVYLGPPNNGTNASNRARISIDGTRKRTVKFGRRIATVAHLRDENGRPIVGAQVTVLERMNTPGASWTPARAPLVTDANGRMRWLIPAKHSRTIRYAYKANLANTEFQSTSDVVLTVFSKSTLRPNRRVVRNGQRVVFSGRLLSKPVPRGGILIDLQAKAGRRWITFKTTRTRGTGRWSTAYTFRSTVGVQTYSFRARVRQDTGYPYALSTTRPVRVKVIG